MTETLETYVPVYLRVKLNERDILPFREDESGWGSYLVAREYCANHPPADIHFLEMPAKVVQMRRMLEPVIEIDLRAIQKEYTNLYNFLIELDKLFEEVELLEAPYQRKYLRPIILC